MSGGGDRLAQSPQPLLRDPRLAPAVLAQDLARRDHRSGRSDALRPAQRPIRSLERAHFEPSRDHRAFHRLGRQLPALEEAVRVVHAAHVQAVRPQRLEALAEDALRAASADVDDEPPPRVVGKVVRDAARPARARNGRAFRAMRRALVPTARMLAAGRPRRRSPKRSMQASARSCVSAFRSLRESRPAARATRSRRRSRMRSSSPTTAATTKWKLFEPRSTAARVSEAGRYGTRPLYLRRWRRATPVAASAAARYSLTAATASRNL